MINTVAADALATQGARSSAAMVLNQFSQNIPEGLMASKIIFKDMCNNGMVPNHNQT